MFSPDQINAVLKQVLAQLGGTERNSEGRKNSSASNNSQEYKNIAITPSQALVIAGILGGTLEVNSVLVDKDQTIEILLIGSLKRKTDLEKMLDQIGSMPFDEVVKAMLGRL